MSGHSKFSNIKHRKNAQDQKRAKVFVKITREIMVAVQQGGPDPSTNPALRLSLIKARANNMPKSNYERAISRAQQKNQGENFEEFTYEGYARGGVAIIVECLSDNRNRTGSNVKSYFNRSGATLGQAKSVNRLFHRTGIIIFESEALNEEELLEPLLALDIEDYKFYPEVKLTKIILPADQIDETQKALKGLGVEEFIECTTGFIPETVVSMNNNNADSLKKLIITLLADDDVKAVYHNYADENGKFLAAMLSID